MGSLTKKRVTKTPEYPSTMHPLSGGYGGYGLENQQSPQEAGSPQQDPSGGGNGAVGEGQNGSGPNYSDINQILDQILNITDQSLDEAQVRKKIIIRLRTNTYVETR